VPHSSAPQPQRPREVTWALWLLIAQGALGVFNLALWPYSRATAVVSLVLLGGLIFGLARRRNWVRMAYLVVFILLAVLSLPELWLEWGLWGGTSLLLGLTQGLGLVLQLAALVLVFRPKSGDWFRHRERRT